MSKNYIGQMGYTIYKDEITNETAKYIENELNVKPFVPKAMGMQKPTSFPVYRESASRYYLPKFFGISNFGDVNCRLPKGEEINAKFNGTLRDYQTRIVSKYIDYVKKNGTNYGGGCLEIDTGMGKCNGINTPIMMYDGTIKMVQDVKVGDILMGDDSTPRNVLTLARGREQMYEVIPHKGDPYTVNESHILSLKWTTSKGKNIKKYAVRDISVLDYLKLGKTHREWLKGYKVPIVFPKKEVKIDPYLLGYWLGDGASKGTLISTQESYVLKYLTADCFKNKHPSLYLQYTGDQYDYRINSFGKGGGASKPNELMDYLRDYNLIQNKHIPHDYKCNDRTTQLELLAGILDSDGSATFNGYDLIQKNEKLFDDIIFLARSLGFAAYKSKCKKSCMYKGEKREGTYYRTHIHGKGVDEIPVKCPRKKVSPRRQIKDALNTGITIKKLEVDDYYGFEIDGNRRFVLGDFTVTHNTVMGIDIISKMRLKTIILVHKEFLMNQWIERINEFMPDARVGKLQGKVIDIEQKDIVIAMIQSLSMKEYNVDLFKCFGLMIIDEVHHMGAEVFSNSLCKVVTPYTLGLSATMERKDGLSKVFKMFLGETIHVEKRDTSEQSVLIKTLQYKVDDDEFNSIKYDFRGNPQYSSMITKLCNYNNRSEFILDYINYTLQENPKQQIIVLGHNKSLLKYLYEAIGHRNIANGSVGYYVGGMKETDLKISETKQVIIATYSMASEGLDIKTLTTLVLATPKTDIIQAVGRILRVKHSQPVVIDIVDSHEVFQRQYQKRKAFYRKQKYKIIETNNGESSFDIKNWKVTYDPNNKKVHNDLKLQQEQCLIDL